MPKIWRKINTLLSKIFTRKITLVAIFLIVFLGVFGLVSPARAFGNLGEWLASGLLLPLAALLGKVLLAIIEILIGIVQYNDFVNNPAVQTGWTIIRDICNMFFILVLLVIAFGTVFKIETYRYNKLLGRLIMMAVLINFSKMIAGFFIDISQVVMLTFVNGFKDTAAGNFTEAFALRQMLGFTTAGAPQGWEALGIGLLAIIMILIAMMVMIVMVVVFLMRIIMLWILVVLSPLAYLLYAFPGQAQQYSHRWWSSFGKYVATGPVLAFFIWLGLAVLTGFGEPGKNVSNEILKVTVPEGEQGSVVEEVQFLPSGVGSPTGILNFIISIAMFVGALMVAQQMGGVAGNFAGSAIGKLRGVGMGAVKAGLLPAKGAWELTKSGGRKVRRGVRDFLSEKAPWANVPATIKGAIQRGQEAEKFSKEYSEAGGREMWERMTTGGRLRIPHRARTSAAYESARARDYAHMTKEEIAALAPGIFQLKGFRGRLEKRSFGKTAFEKGFFDDFGKKYKDRIISHFKAEGQNEYDELIKKGISPEEAEKKAKNWQIIGGKNGKNWYGTRQMDWLFKQTIGDDVEARRLRGELIDIARRTGHGEYAGLSGEFDEKKMEVSAPSTYEAVLDKMIEEISKMTERAARGLAIMTFTNLREAYMPDLDEHGNIQWEDKEKTRIKMLRDEKGELVPVTRAGQMDRANIVLFEKAFRNATLTNASEHAGLRNTNILMGGTSSQSVVGRDEKTKTQYMIGDDEDLKRIKSVAELAPETARSFFKGAGGDDTNVDSFKFMQVDKEGKKIKDWDAKELFGEELYNEIKAEEEARGKKKKKKTKEEAVEEGEEGKEEEGEAEEGEEVPPTRPRTSPSGGATAAAGDIENILKEVHKEDATYRPQIQYGAETTKGSRSYNSLDELYRDKEVIRDEEGNPKDIRVLDQGKEVDVRTKGITPNIWYEIEAKLEKLKEGRPSPEALVDKSLEKYEATKAKAKEYQDKYKNASAFFLSSEFQKNREKYFDQDEFELAQKFEQERQEAPEVGGVASFATRKSNVIGINANTFAGGKYKDKAGLYVSDPTVAKEVMEEYEKSIEKEMADLKQRNPEVDEMLGQIDEWKRELKRPETIQNVSQRNAIRRQLSEIGKTATGRDALRLNNLMEAKARIRTEEPKNITIVNQDAVGYNARHTIAHEDSHGKLNELDKDGSSRKKMFEEAYSEEEREQALDQVRQKMGYLPKKEAIKLGKETMSEEAAIRELFAEGMANALESRADKSPDAIKLKPELVNKVKEAGAKHVNEKGEAEPIEFMTSEMSAEVQAIGKAPSVLASKMQAKYAQMTQKAKDLAASIEEKAKAAAAPITRVVKGIQEKMEIAAKERELKKQKKQYDVYQTEADNAGQDATSLLSKLQEAGSASKAAQLDYQQALSQGNKEIGEIQKEINKLGQERQKAIATGNVKAAGDYAAQIQQKRGQQEGIKHGIENKKVAADNAGFNEEEAKRVAATAVNIADELRKQVEEKGFDLEMASHGGVDKRIKELEEVIAKNEALIKQGVGGPYVEEKNEENKEELARIRAKLEERAKAKEKPVEIKAIPAKEYPKAQAEIASIPVKAKAEIEEIPKEIKETEEVKQVASETEKVEKDVENVEKKKTITDEEFFQTINNIEKQLNNFSKTLDETTEKIGRIDISKELNEKVIKKLQDNIGQVKKTDELFGNSDDQRYFLLSFKKALEGLRGIVSETKGGKKGEVGVDIEKVEKKIREKESKI